MNYKETVFLPRTEFPMRAGLPKKEPEILEGWKKPYFWLKKTYFRLKKLHFLPHTDKVD